MLRAAVMHLLSRALSVAASMVSVVVVTRTLGITAYATFVLVTTAMSVLPFADLGLGLGLVTSLSRARGSRAVEGTLVASTLKACALAGLAALILSIGLSVAFVLVGSNYYWIPIVVGVNLGLSIPFTVVYKIWLGRNDALRVAVWQIWAAPLTVAALCLAALLHPSALVFSIVALYPPTIVAIVASCRFRGARRVWPSIVKANLRDARDVARYGFVYCVQSACIAIALQSDVYIISIFYSAHEVSRYGISLRFSTIFMTMVSSATIPLWAHFGRASSSKVTQSDNSLLFRLVLWAASAGLLFAVALFTSIGPVVTLLSGPEFVASREVVIALGVSTVCQTILAPLAMYVNGIGVTRGLVWSAVAMLVCNVTTSLLLTRIVGPSGPAWGTAVSVALCQLVPYLVFVRKSRKAEAVSSAS